MASTDAANGKNTPPDSAFVAANLGKIMRADEDFQIAKNEHQSVTKSVEGKGLDLKAAKQAIKIKKSGKVEETVAYLQNLFLYLRILGVPISDKQLDMFDVSASGAPMDERAYEEGLFAGRLGWGMDACGYGQDTAAGQKWLEGFHIGGQDRKQVMAMQAEAPEHISGDDAVPMDDAKTGDAGAEKSSAKPSVPPKPPAAKKKQAEPAE